MSLVPHPYKTISQIFDVSSDVSDTTVSIAISENINLERKLLSRFDGLTKELLNVKDVIICKPRMSF